MGLGLEVRVQGQGEGDLVREGAPELGIVGGETAGRAASDHVRRARLAGERLGEGAVAGRVDRHTRTRPVFG